MKYFFFVLLIPVFLSSCCDDEISFGECIDQLFLNQEEEEFVSFAKNKISWACKNITHYSVIVVLQNQICFGTHVEIEVINDEIISTMVLQGNEDLSSCNLFTIKEIFEILEVALDSSIQIPLQSIPDADIFVADDVRIEYDSQCYFPLDVHIDYVVGIADEEFNIELRDFKQLE